MRITMPLLSMGAVLLIWELSVWLFDISLYVLPAPSMIINAILENGSLLWMHSLVTLQEALLGLFLAVLFAVLIAILMDLSKPFRLSVFPHLVVTQTVPIMILGPLFAIWLGFGMAPKVVMVVFMCFFPIVIAFADALAQVDVNQINLLKSFGANKRQIYRYVKIPAAMGALISGTKVAATYCMGGAIVGEWLSASAGLGYYMIRLKNGYMLDQVFACVVVIILWSLLLHLALSGLERLVFPYRTKRKGNET